MIFIGNGFCCCCCYNHSILCWEVINTANMREKNNIFLLSINQLTNFLLQDFICYVEWKETTKQKILKNDLSVLCNRFIDSWLFCFYSSIECRLQFSKCWLNFVLLLVLIHSWWNSHSNLGIVCCCQFRYGIQQVLLLLHI